MNDAESEIDTHLQNLEERSSELVDQCYYASSDRLAHEIRRTARAESRLMPYLHALFTIMNRSEALLNPETSQKAAIEMIALLEDDGRARMIQSDFPEHEYSQAVHWYSSCAYDNLAKATAIMKGYNSEGLHACIAEGIQVCRRTNKMRCITCFQEYATDVYRSADDLQMALHFARSGVAHEKPGPHDRRWAGAKDLVRIQLLLGDFPAATEAIERAWEWIETWHNPRYARLETMALMREIAMLLEEPGRWDDRFKLQTILDERPPEGEFPSFDWRIDTLDAVSSCLSGTPDAAIEVLTNWGNRLLQNRCLNTWFENQLRLLVALRLAGKKVEFSQVAEQLEMKAKIARDWVTLQTLELLRDETVPPCPVPIVKPIRKPKHSTAVENVVSENSSENSQSNDSAMAPQAKDKEERSGPPEFIREIWTRLSAFHQANQNESDIDDSNEAILETMLAIDPSAVRSGEDTDWMLHTLGYLLFENCPNDRAWDWAEQVAQPYLKQSTTLNLLARVGLLIQHYLVEGAEAPVALERIEQMFRESLELDLNQARNFARAGDFFLYVENMGEAERCFARGLRLNRANGDLALKLAGIYQRTERNRDALAVLDMCLREGCEDAEVLWEAGIAAHGLGSYEAAISYLDAYDKLQQDVPWVHYYRAFALLELERYSEAMESAHEESKRNPDCPFPVAIFCASASVGLGNLEQSATFVEEVFAIPLREVNYLTVQGLHNLFGLFWKGTHKFLVQNPALLERVEDRMIASSLAPNPLFAYYRESEELVEGLNFYICVFQQPLDTNWEAWHGRLSGEDGWDCYQVSWGVLARSQEEAIQIAMSWQQRAFPLPAKVQEVHLEGEGYRDKPGVVWQGYRYNDG